MPAFSFADSRVHIGVFNNAIHSGQERTTSARQLQGLLGVFNTPSGLNPNTHVLLPEGIYPQLSSQGSENVDHRVVTRGIGAAIKRHPVAAGILLTTAVLATVAVGTRQASGSSELATQWPDSVPPPQPLIMSGNDSPANSETVVGICERAINRFPPTSGTPANLPSMTALQSIKSDAENILRVAQGMARDSAVEFQELERAAQCSGVSLRESKVEAMIADLQAMRSRLFEDAPGASVDMSLRLLAAQMQASEIDRRLVVLARTSSHLYDATLALNARLMELAG